MTRIAEGVEGKGYGEGEKGVVKALSKLSPAEASELAQILAWQPAPPRDIEPRDSLGRLIGRRLPPPKASQVRVRRARDAEWAALSEQRKRNGGRPLTRHRRDLDDFIRKYDKAEARGFDIETRVRRSRLCPVCWRRFVLLPDKSIPIHLDPRPRLKRSLTQECAGSGSGRRV